MVRITITTKPTRNRVESELPKFFTNYATRDISVTKPIPKIALIQPISSLIENDKLEAQISVGWIEFSETQQPKH
jgi:hypothetical protein